MIRFYRKQVAVTIALCQFANVKFASNISTFQVPNNKSFFEDVDLGRDRGII